MPGQPETSRKKEEENQYSKLNSVPKWGDQHSVFLLLRGEGEGEKNTQKYTLSLNFVVDLRYFLFNVRIRSS